MSSGTSDMSESRYPADVEKGVAVGHIEDSAERTYAGIGTADDPYVVDWYLDDPEDPYNWPKPKKWLITAQLALCTFTISFSSSAYTGGMQYTMEDFGISDDIAILGISLYVLGFALGIVRPNMLLPLFLPLNLASILLHVGTSDRLVFLATGFLYSAFQLQGALSRNVATLLSCRLLTGIFGASPLTNAGGTISDIFNFRERGLASAIYATVPFLGPVFIVTEPIVLAAAIYSSIVYGTLYALFSGFPIIFQQHRGFTPGQGGLAFVGVGLGIMIGTASQTLQNNIYWRIMERSETGRAPPEA
ncbi:hypothetical protein EST38_g1644 [Candolleomyces aberdarensis]|uniref:Major facilitator superfamily (MFS) profile domain-containing protein n=1 Tax=Candolleomyces aberdarensis TaxID=2316362 RepID=A0A4Q2DXK6_9AGAR|nr:hypothetical protein EST38_g1644 [Candolleomyces aberdarensis]